MDDEIYSQFREEFRELKVDVLTEDDLKKDENKQVRENINNFRSQGENAALVSWRYQQRMTALFCVLDEKSLLCRLFWKTNKLCFLSQSDDSEKQLAMYASGSLLFLMKHLQCRCFVRKYNRATQSCNFTFGNVLNHSCTGKTFYLLEMERILHEVRR